MGRSFGTNRIQNDQYDLEQKYRTAIKDNIEKILDEGLMPGDSIIIYMFGDGSWGGTLTKTEDGYIMTYHHNTL